MGRPFHRRRHRSTPQGQHVPVMLPEVLSTLQPKPGDIAVDCTLGFAGHSFELLKRIGPDGKLFAFDLDAENIESANAKLSETGFSFQLTHGNFAGFPTALEGREVDCLLADLGMSSMQIDDASRGFSYMREGPLDMRMDRSRGKTAAQLLQTLDEEELAEMFLEIGDEPQAAGIARAIIVRRQTEPFETTQDLRELILKAAPVKILEDRKAGTARQQTFRPVARVFQTLRIVVNRELSNLQELLRVLPWTLKAGGRAAIISFHSGEDRLVKKAFKEGLERGEYSEICEEPLRPGLQERFDNPRSRSAKLRWAIK
ncbi:16S rRNA (cytosine(1402)-N(4))-methyltransferase RsmH [Telmatocola sphagniphila]|uniref:Ribosomal RNA small subunit methyltransferase H n=1 Tax=Telmatocola sphagniphila TaxID=1123043 RepID=A0A8E6B6Y2_9BACT|nr:16S rRNA (cytosine(1402)-N(4))-methyltransferase RsmH [Telmatocola sphagniphila]QVL33027.1 16S rRNA (cytosine(1402)-N(4))-methyltransferase RsmH [Telmatocola sphagniphila]